MAKSRLSRSKSLIIVTTVLLLCPAAQADWPTYRHDNARSGATDESLEVPLQLSWVYTSVFPPRPAWSGPAKRPREGWLLRPRVIFDDAFQVAASAGAVYFGSSSDNKVYCLDAKTGRQRWVFYTAGPVRLAPVLYEGRLLVGSDDGFVYCLKAKSGELIWKMRPGANGEKLLGNGSLISRWPIRTSVLVADGTAYFTAGIFPHENVYVCAVRVEDGGIVWRNDRISEQQAYRNDFSPQGYLLAAGERLFIPSGRALPVGFDRATGRVTFTSNYGWRGREAGGMIGGTYALLADEQIYTGTQYHLLALDQRRGRVGFGWFPGRRLAVVGPMAYMATGSEIVAMERIKYAEASRARHALEYRLKGLRSSVRNARGTELERRKAELAAAEKQLEELLSQKIDPVIKWRVASRSDAELVLCKNLVIVGGQGRVDAYDRQTGKSRWSTEVDGKARGLAIDAGRVFVSTNTGRVYCFASGQARAKGEVLAWPKPPVSNPYPPDELTAVYEAAAEAILMESGVKKGYCLVLGGQRGRLAYELARRSELRVIAVEPDGRKVQQGRQALDAAGLYGQRVVMEQAEPSSLGYSNYFANLIVCESLLLDGKLPGQAKQIARHLKPCGGVICMGTPADAPGRKSGPDAQELEAWLRGMELGPARVSTTNGLWASVRRGPLPGAGKWTHQYAEPGNTACSDDRIVGGSLGLLWFGEPGPAVMVNRHNAAAAPLAVNGRLFVQGENIVMAYDSYNGLKLWERKIPGAMRTRLKRTECGNLAASDDSFFVAVQDKCLRLDAETGQTRTTYDLPPGVEGEWPKWGYVAYVEGLLYGSAMTRTGVSNALFAVDVATGRTLWTHHGKNIVNLTIAIGDGWVFFIDSSITPEQREELLRQDKSHLKNLSPEEANKAEAALKKLDARLAVALDARTGGRLWEKPVDVTDCSGIGIGGGELSAMYHDGVLVLCGANANGHYWRQFLSGQFSQRRLVALSAKTGAVLWARDANYRHRPVIVGDTVVAEPWAYDLKTGRQRTRLHPLTGEPTPWQVFRPGHHCGAISACPQMLFMRSGSTSYYDLLDDSGIRHFAGHRLGCWINAIPADGLALAPEASAGCICLFPIVCSIALEPRPDHDRWGIFSARGRNTPVRQLAVNFGAPGDRRDSQGRLWLSYPRPELPGDRDAMGFAFDVKTEFFEEGRFHSDSTASAPPAAGVPWVFTSCARGLKRCVVPLLSEDDAPAEYTVDLYFADSDNGGGKRIFDIKLQGQVVLSDFDLSKEASANGNAVVRRFTSVPVEKELEIEFVAKDVEPGSAADATVLCGLELRRQSGSASVGK